MAINTSWQVKIGTVASPTTFTSRVTSLNITQTVDVSEIGRGTCVITLLNKDGALTPGGGGTYSSTDWFAQGVFVSSLTNTGGANTETQVFHGVIVDFDLTDDGVYSTVTITAQDGLTVAAKTVGSVIQTSTTYTTLYGQLVDRNGIVFPRLGQSNAEGIVNNEFADTQPTVGVGFGQVIRPTTYADALQTYLIPSVNDVTWPTTISTSAGITNYNIISLGNTTTRSAANRVNFFFDQATTLSGTELPFDDQGFVQAFNNDTLITQAQIQASITGSTTQTSTASTNPTYGNRTVQYLSTLNDTDADALTVATRLTNRYSTSRFRPVQLQVNARMIATRASDAAKSRWEALLGISSGLWQRVVISWTGSGATLQSAVLVIKGRRISVTPQDTLVTLTLGNWADNHGFILDTDQLDVDRLG